MKWREGGWQDIEDTGQVDAEPDTFTSVLPGPVNLFDVMKAPACRGGVDDQDTWVQEEEEQEAAATQARIWTKLGLQSVPGRSQSVQRSGATW